MAANEFQFPIASIGTAICMDQGSIARGIDMSTMTFSQFALATPFGSKSGFGTSTPAAPVHAVAADPTSIAAVFDGVVKFDGANATGSGSAVLGANCPAVTPAAPYTWVRAVSADGSTVFFPVWK
jgi:hypothetical protein